MKIFVKFLLFVLVLGMAAPFFLKRPDGRPWMSLDDILPDVNQLQADAESAINSAERSLDRATSSDPQAGKTKVYKWRDSSGNWHLSDKPIFEAKGRDQAHYVDPDTNMIEGLPESPPEVEQSPADGVTNEVPLPLTVSPGQVEKLIEDSKAVQGLMDKRAEQLDNL